MHVCSIKLHICSQDGEFCYPCCSHWQLNSFNGSRELRMVSLFKIAYVVAIYSKSIIIDNVFSYITVHCQELV